jgi:hypothetical protein
MWQATSSIAIASSVENIPIVVFPWVCGLEMADLREKRVCVKLRFKLRKTAAETQQMLKQAFGGKCLGHTQTYGWYDCFKNGLPSTDDDARSGRP